MDGLYGLSGDNKGIGKFGILLLNILILFDYVFIISYESP